MKLKYFIVGVVLVIALSGGFVFYKLRGLRNNNPSNLRSFSADGWKHWQGATGVDEAYHIIFTSPLMGLRALFKNLQAYREKYNLVTLEAIFNRWAPVNDPDAKNDPYEYALNVSRQIGVDITTPLDETNEILMVSLAKAIIKEENSNVQPYSEAMILDAFHLSQTT